MDEVILSIDCGTQSLRTLIFSIKGELIDKVQMNYTPYFSPKPGWAEQDPEVFWQSLCKGCKELKQKHSDLFGKIIGVGVTTQRNTMVNVDKHGIPLRPAITWLDQRKAKKVYTPNPFINSALFLVGMSEAIIKTQTDGKCNWIKQNQPEIWEKTYKYLQVSGFLNYRLTGNFADSIASQIGHIPFNYKKMKWADAWDLGRKLFPIEKDKLPDLVTPGEVIGKISNKASEETGILAGTPVIACGSDKGCETIGMGVSDEKMVSLSFGTTATIQTTSKKYFEALRFMPPYPAPIPGHYNPEVEILRGFWMITWFKNEFAHKEILEAKEKGTLPEIILNTLLQRIPAGSMGLIVQPYWSPGLKHLSAKGSIIGFGDVHTKAHIYKAIIEGLCYGLFDGLKKIEKSGKTIVEKAAVSGGASQSDEICQICSDVFNLPIVRGKTYETSGVGSAIITAVGCKAYPSFEKAIDNMVKYDRTFMPNAENVKIYHSLFNNVYQAMYDVLEPLYVQIREITGYPEAYN
ncbi:MAG: FGGY-family carbohydrate kinase [Desulfobacterales bacterium]|nr:FGGY-family carbohydrate kinase [Desulfobacterales bacterium]